VKPTGRTGVEPAPKPVPWVISHVSGRDDARAHGIEMNIVADPRECIRVFDEQRLISALENMPMLPMALK
jgi:hypothetical protein